MKILSVVGARPNFMKIAPIAGELRKRAVSHVLVHTGQHYDEKMSKLFFEDLAIPEPDYYLGVGSGTHARQTAEVMIKLEAVLEKEKPALLIVVGDVNSTLAAAITAAKLNIPVAHVESGLRSFDRSMPEEINRIVTDSISNYHFVTEESALDHLKKEGISAEGIFFVGNTMIDSLLKHRERASGSEILAALGIESGKYGVVTLHRPSNVDDRNVLRIIMGALCEISADLPIIFPVHPRTRKQIDDLHTEASLSEGYGNIKMIEPLGYLDFLKLMSEARLVCTDSGGIQEETTVLGIPCLTLRYNTERPVTITAGTNVLVGADREAILREARRHMKGIASVNSIPPLWDGHAAERIVDVIVNELNLS